MYIRKVDFFALLAFIVGPHVIGGVQVFAGTQSTKPSWIHGSLSERDQSNKHHLQPQYPTQPIPQYTSEYPSEYTPYYPPQYTPPYPTQGRPQNPPQHKPTSTIPPKPQQSKPPPPPVQQQYPVHHNQILNPSIKPTPSLPIPAFDQYNHRFPDGSYEFRYELPDETVRYERGYFILFNHERCLVVRGYYSYKLPGAGYLTVFYTADQYGYRQDSSGITPQRPQLPRTLGERKILVDEESLNGVSSINDNKLQ